MSPRRVHPMRFAAAAALIASACGPKAPPAGSTTTAAPAAADASVAAPAAGDAPAAPPEPLPLDEDLPTLAARNADLVVALADALAGDGDCAALAERARGVMADYRDVRAATARAAENGRRSELDAALEAHAERITTAAARMRPAIERCGSDAAFAAALTPFDVP